MSKSAPISALPLFAPRQDPGPERAKAESVLDVMANERRAWLVRMRGALAVLSDARVARWGEDDPRAYVCGDDSRRLSEAQADLALPAGASPNLFGAVFRGPDWQRSAHRDHQSSTDGSHGNDLYRWRYVGHQRSAA